MIKEVQNRSIKTIDKMSYEFLIIFKKSEAMLQLENYVSSTYLSNCWVHYKMTRILFSCLVLRALIYEFRKSVPGLIPNSDRTNPTTESKPRKTNTPYY